MIYFAIAVGVVSLAISVPIFLVFGLSGSLVVVHALNLPWSVITQVTFDSITKYVLLAIPLYIFSGMVMVEAGMARRLVDVFIRAVGHLPGGLGVAMVLTMGFFGALCGSILAAIVAIGSILIPIMVEKGYPRPFVAALAASSAFLDTLIPPSNGAIIFSAITGEPVSRTFAAGILPGVVYGLLLILLVLWKCRHLPRAERATFRQFAQSVYVAIPALFTPVIILGGIYTGLTTATESAAIAGLWAVVVGFAFYGQLTPTGLWNALKSTAVTTTVIFAIIATATFLSVALTYTRLPHKIIQFAVDTGVTPFLFFAAQALVVLVLGTFMEVVPIMYLTIPILAPIALALNIPLVQLYIVNGAFVGLGMLTPPVCVGAYTAAAVAQEKSASVIRALVPWFLLLGMVHGLVCMVFPELSTWLPSLV
jgi:C4-dicarboxylate transporter DctM subunit